MIKLLMNNKITNMKIDLVIKDRELKGTIDNTTIFKIVIIHNKVNL